jgi:hypothetical protein
MARERTICKIRASTRRPNFGSATMLVPGVQMPSRLIGLSDDASGPAASFDGVAPYRLGRDID